MAFPQLRNRPAYIFDLDGTLVDTAPDLIGALNRVLEDHGRSRVEPTAVHRLVGRGAKIMLERAMAMTGEPAAADALPGLVDDFIAHYRRHIAAESRPFPGVEETLAALAGQVRLGVLTNKPQELTDLLLPALGLDRFFGAVHGAGRLEVVKPDAAVFHHVMEELGSAPPHSATKDNGGAVMIGDSATDVATARAAGVPVIAVDYGYTEVPAAELGADAVTGDFREIPELAARLLAL